MTKFLSVAALGFAILIFTQASAYTQASSPTVASCAGSAAGSLAPVRNSLASVRNRFVNRRVAPVRNTVLRVQSRSCGG